MRTSLKPISRALNTAFVAAAVLISNSDWGFCRADYRSAGVGLRYLSPNGSLSD